MEREVTVKAAGFVKFDDENTILTVGIDSGFKMYRLKTLQPCLEHVMVDVIAAQRLCFGSMLAIVTSKSPNVLLLQHAETSDQLWRARYPCNVVSVHSNLQLMVVGLENGFIMYDTERLEVYHKILDLPSGCTGLSLLSGCTSEGECFLTYPCSAETGKVQVFDVSNKENVATIHAHKNPIAMLTINRDKTLLASVSKRGTVIRLIAFPAGSRLAEYRRGLQLAEVYSMTFSEDSKFLCCSFSTGTIHIFSLVDESENKGWLSYITSTANHMLSGNKDLTIRDNESGTLWNLGSRVFSAATTIPVSVYSQWSRMRAFAVARVQTKGVRCIAVLRTLESEEPERTVVVSSEDGHVYVYNFDPIKGGECGHLKTIDITEEITKNLHEEITANEGGVPAT